MAAAAIAVADGPSLSADELGPLPPARGAFLGSAFPRDGVIFLTSAEGVPFRVSVEPGPPAQIHGVCRDQAGNVTAGVELALYRLHTNAAQGVLLARAASAADGNYVLHTPDDWQQLDGTEAVGSDPRAAAATATMHGVLVVRAPGYASRSLAMAPLALEQELRVDITLEPAHPVAGQVIDSQQQPVAGALVRLVTGSAASNGDLIHAARTDDEGRFTIADAPAPAVAADDAPPYTVTTQHGVQLLGWNATHIRPLVAVECPGYAQTRVELTALKPETPIVLKPAVEIVGRVVDLQRKPLAGRRVAAWSSLVGLEGPRTAEHMLQAHAITNERGEYRIRTLPAGRYDLTLLSAPGSDRSRIQGVSAFDATLSDTPNEVPTIVGE